MKRFRISFQIVNPISHPEAYRNGKPFMPIGVVPESWWQNCERESNDAADVFEQADGCTQLITKGELIRNVKVEESISGPWQLLEPSPSKPEGV